MSRRVPPGHHGRTLGWVSALAAVASVVVFGVVAYRLWGTGLHEADAQVSLRAELESQLVVRPPEVVATTSADAPLERTASASTTPPSNPGLTAVGDPSDSGAVTAATTSRPQPAVEREPLIPIAPAPGTALASLRIPAIGVDKVAISGVDVDDLRRGPGHYAETSLPGHRGNAGFAGHRSTYGAPFADIDELVPGDEIVVTTVQGTFTYRVMDPQVAFSRRLDDTIDVGSGHVIVDPSATWVLGNFNDDRITLTACHPKLSIRQRIVVSAELVGESIEPAGAGEGSAARPGVGRIAAP